MRKLICCLIIVFICSMSYAFDFGLILDQNADYGGYGDEGSFGYSGSLIPRFSALLGNTADIYISAGVRAAYYGKWGFTPELLRTELSLYNGSFELKAGRVYHSDPLGLITDGLFDGARLSLESEAGTFSLGAWYTGFLYKGRANILMTAEDREIYIREFNFADFINSKADSFTNAYFAPRRVVSSLGWERLSLGGPLQAKAALLAQIDLSKEAPLHSQYLAAKVSLPGRMFGFEAGGTLETIEEGGGFGMAAAADLALYLTPTAQLPQRLSFLGRFSSGHTFEGKILAFQPVTTKSQGDILKVGLTGISLVSLDYTVQPTGAFSAGLTTTSFIRSDLVTYGAYPINGESDGRILGTEFFGRLLWSPYSDMQVNLGGGLFLPSLGNVKADAEVSWRVELNVIVSFL